VEYKKSLREEFPILTKFFVSWQNSLVGNGVEKACLPAEFEIWALRKFGIQAPLKLVICYLDCCFLVMFLQPFTPVSTTVMARLAVGNVVLLDLMGSCTHSCWTSDTSLMSLLSRSYLKRCIWLRPLCAVSVHLWFCINKGLLLQKCWIWKSSLRIWHMFLYHYCTSCPWLDFLLPDWNLNEVNGNFPKRFVIPTGQLWTPMRTSPWESLVLCAGKLLSAQLSWEGGCCEISTNFCCRWEFGQRCWEGNWYIPLQV